MKDKKEQKDNRADSFRSLNEILQFVDNFLVQAHQITPEEEEAFAAAPTYDDMTEEDWQKEYEARKDFEQQHKNEVKFNKLRKFLHIGIEAKRDDPDSELFRTSKELLDFVDRCESDPSSVRSYEGKKFRTALITYKELLKGEATSAEKPAETKRNTTPSIRRCRIWTCVKRIPRWIYVLVLFLAALLTILYYLGWLEPVKAFIYNIF